MCSASTRRLSAGPYGKTSELQRSGWTVPPTADSREPIAHLCHARRSIRGLPMRLVNVFFIVLLLLVLMVLGNLYLTNHDLLVREVVLFGESIKLQSVILVTFLLGFLLNVLYTGIMEVIRLV